MVAVNWGSVPDWIAGLGTAGALIATVLLLRHEIDDRRRRDAARVAAWIGEAATAADDPIRVTDWGESPGMLIGWHVWIHNAGETPIYQAHLKAGNDGRLPTEYLERFEVIPPGVKVSTIFGAPEMDPAVCQQSFLVAVAFTDSAGRHWLRDERGKLQRLVAAPTMPPL